MTITKTENGDMVTLTLEGWLDAQSAPELQSEVQKIGETAKSMVIDMEKLQYVSSAGIRQLVAIYKKMNGQLVIKNTSEELMDIFHILFTDCRRQKRISLYGNAKPGERNAKIAVEHIEQHYRENLSLNSMAQLLGLHPIYFSKYFKEVTGTGFNTYVNTVRMKHALDDLIRHGMTIADAAKANGFSNVKSFETICKRSYGLTPLQFKKQQLMVS